MASDVTIRHVLPEDLPQVSALHSRVFGPGRFARTAYRIREGTPLVSPYCRKALIEEQLVGAIRYTAVRIGGEPGALLLGPLAVEPILAGKGYGRRLIAGSLAAAEADSICLVVLVGDLPYYGRFGFVRIPPGDIRLPGPVDPDRVLGLELAPRALSRLAGLITADRMSVADGIAGAAR